MKYLVMGIALVMSLVACDVSNATGRFQRRNVQRTKVVEVRQRQRVQKVQVQKVKVLKIEDNHCHDDVLEIRVR